MTPMASKANFTSAKAHDEPLYAEGHGTYRSLIGKILYASVCTRIDIPFSVGVLARRVHAPGHRHLALDKRLVRYLSGTSSRALFYPCINETSECKLVSAKKPECAVILGLISPKIGP